MAGVVQQFKRGVAAVERGDDRQPAVVQREPPHAGGRQVQQTHDRRAQRAAVRDQQQVALLPGVRVPQPVDRGRYPREKLPHAFSARWSPRVAPGEPRGVAMRVAVCDFRVSQPLPGAVAPFPQGGKGGQRQLPAAHDRLRRLRDAPQVARVRGGEARRPQPRCGRLRLRASPGVERHVRLSLPAAREVPVGLPVAHQKPSTHQCASIPQTRRWIRRTAGRPVPSTPRAG